MNEQIAIWARKQGIASYFKHPLP